ncbi:MAG: DivIVA domain-containing protein [Christensenellaceae bacterium]|nr:DivIVA domain-containing protein [Christensenellaceae bacterium]
MNRDDVINKEFPHAFVGYDVAEVDLFLDEVIREFDRLHNEIDVLTFRLEQLMEKTDANDKEGEEIKKLQNNEK